MKPIFFSVTYVPVWKAKKTPIILFEEICLSRSLNVETVLILANVHVESVQEVGTC